jgi:hypothetical protein
LQQACYGGHILSYDRNGNRASDTSWGQQVVGQQVLSFDESSGQVGAAQGALLTQFASGPSAISGGQQMAGQQVQSFNESGTLLTQFSSRAGVITEYYGYDRMNRVQSVSTDSLYDTNLNAIGRVTLDTRYYDAAGRLVQNGPAGSLSNDYVAALNSGAQANGAITQVNSYDANGRLQAQHFSKPDGSFDHDIVY